MKISFDVEFTDEEQERLAKVLSCKKTELPRVLQAWGKAAISEYTHMFLGRSSLRVAADAKETRLLAMIQHVFAGAIPDEQIVGRVFHITPTQARSLIRSVLAKYQYDLDGGINTSYVQLIESCSQRGSGGPFEVMIRSSAAVEGLNQILVALDGGLPKIARKPRAGGVYVVDIASYDKLRAYFELPAREG